MKKLKEKGELLSVVRVKHAIGKAGGLKQV